jgi:hypothetical protein
VVNDTDADVAASARPPDVAGSFGVDHEDQGDELDGEEDEGKCRRPSQPAVSPGGSASDRYDQPRSSSKTPRPVRHRHHLTLGRASPGV